MAKNFCPVEPSKPDNSRSEKFRHLRQLGQSFDKFDTASKGGKTDGIVSKDDLQAVADGKVQASKEEKAAAQYLLRDEATREAVDKASKPSGEADGKISREEVDAARIEAHNEVRSNPDAARKQQVEQQQKNRWDSMDDIRRNLKENPDLSTYSPQQLKALNLIAKTDPKFSVDLQKSTADYVNQYTSKFDHIPETKEFQKLLYDQVTNVEGGAPGNEDAVKSAQDRLKTQLREKITQGAIDSLKDQSGDDAVKESLNKFASEGLKNWPNATRPW